MLSNVIRESITRITLEAVSAAVKGECYSPEPSELGELNVKCGGFVTLKTNGNLRGCLGCFTSDEPLYLTIARYAKLSATEDPRFVSNRIDVSELDKLQMDISILSPLEACEKPQEIVLGKHGIYIKSGWSSGCFLPQVATETGWSVDEFWSHCCCHKARLPADAWKTGGAELFTFTAEVIEVPASG